VQLSCAMLVALSREPGGVKLHGRWLYF
jgi:hypothetical protein